MPLTSKGKTIEHAMEKEYGNKKGKSVFYASKNKGTIKGVEKHSADKALKKKALESRSMIRSSNMSDTDWSTYKKKTSKMADNLNK